MLAAARGRLEVHDRRAAAQVEFIFPRTPGSGAVFLNRAGLVEDMFYVDMLAERVASLACFAERAQLDQLFLLKVHADGPAATDLCGGACASKRTRVADGRSEVSEA